MPPGDFPGQLGKQTEVAWYVSLYAVAFYLTCEALLTKSIVPVIVTDAVALLVLDAVSRSWDCVSTTITLTKSSGPRQHLLKTRAPRSGYAHFFPLN